MPRLTKKLLPPPEAAPDLLVIAGEHSGDAHAAEMVAAYRAANPQATVCAIGGPALERAGAQLLFDLTLHSVVGLIEVLKNYDFFRKVMAASVDWVVTHRPRAVCFVDYPGFNLRLARRLMRAKAATRAGGPTRLLYYISPQLWAWKGHRRFAMAKMLDSLAVIFPFEPAVYADTSLDVHYVGHPFVHPSHEPLVRYELGAPVLLLPGSRQQAVARIFPRLVAAFLAAREDHPSLSATVLYPDEALGDWLKDYLEAHDLERFISTRPTTDKDPHLACAALMSSGTMSLEVALAGIPGAIVYLAHPLTYAIGRRLVKVPYLGIANLLLERPAWPEFIQDAAKGPALPERLLACLDSSAPAQQAAADAATLRQSLSAKAEMTAAQWLGQWI